MHVEILQPHFERLRGFFQLLAHLRYPGSDEFSRTAIRPRFGSTSFKISSCLPLISGAKLDNPVIFPPGRPRLVTTPELTGSQSNAMTMGTVLVACLAAR